MIIRGSPESRTYSLHRPLMNRTVALAAAGAGVLVTFYAIWVASNPKPKVSEERERAVPAEKQRVVEEKALGGSSSNDGFPAHTPTAVMVAYGSQTGNAKEIAQDVFEKLQEMDVTARLSALNDWEKWDPTLAKGTELLICVISTTGNADAPDNCVKFHRFLKRKAHAADMLKGLHFAVLGLGDTNYNEFCYMGRWLDERLDGLGAKRFRPLGCADEATGLEDVVEPWCEALYPAVLKAIESGGAFGGGAEDSAPAAVSVGGAAEGVDTAVSAAPAAPAAPAAAVAPSLVKVRCVRPLSEFVAAETLAEVDEAVGLAKGRLHKSTGLGLYDVVFAAPPAASAYDPASTLASSASAANNGSEAEEYDDDDEKEFVAEVVAARYLTKGGKASDRRVVEATIVLNNASSSASSLSYCVGDAVGLQCPNAPEEVEAVLYHLRRAHAASTTTGGSFFATHGGDAAVKLIYAKGGAPAPLFVAGGGLGSCVLTVRDVLTWGVDLSAPLKPTLLAALAECCASSEEAKALKLLAVKEAHSSDNSGASLPEAESFAYFVGSGAYGAFVSGQSLHLSELLELFPSCAAPLGLLVAALPPLSCRYYSIASSPTAGSGSSTIAASIAFSVVEWSGSPTTSSSEGGVQRRGLCTGWLEDQLRPALQSPPSPSHFLASSSSSSSSSTALHAHHPRFLLFSLLLESNCHC